MSEFCVTYHKIGDIHGHWPFRTALFVKIMLDAFKSEVHKDCVYIGRTGQYKTMLGMLFNEPTYVERIYYAKRRIHFSNWPTHKALFQNFRKRATGK